MTRRTLTCLPLLSSLALFACGDDTPGTDAGSETAGTETAGTDDIGDTDTGTGTSTSTSTSTSTTDDGCPVGAEGCPCTAGGGCDPGLVCEGGTCTAAATTDSTTDTGTDTGTTTDTGTDTTDTTGGNNACAGDEFIEIAAVDATDIDGWNEQMSMLGEGLILAWDQQTQDAFVSFDIDVPCDDTWHIWVRGINQGQNDSYFASVDGEPNPEAVFEIACDNGPQQAVYEWRELNWRDPNDPGCTYLQDPWTQDWLAGSHNFTVRYREAIALSRIWLTNTAMTPPP